MRKFTITSPKFTGHIDLLYNQDEQLCKIDYTQCKLLPQQVTAFNKLAPVFISNLQTQFAGTELTVIEADYEVTFEMFWTRYDSKINKARCLPLWSKLSKLEQIKAYTGITAYDKHLASVGWNKIKANPETYLKVKMWENEYK